MSIFRLTTSQFYQGQLCNNTYHYRETNSGQGDAGELNSLWETELTNAINGIQNAGVANQQVNSLNLANYADYNTAPWSGNGTIATSTTGLPPFYAWAFTQNTIGAIIRHGFKRYCGVDESSLTSGLPNAAINALAGLVATKLLSVLLGVATNYEPVVVRYNTASPPTVISVADVDSVVFKGPTTQRSRKN